MKALSLSISSCLAVLICLFSACSESNEIVELTYQEKENIFLKEFRNKARGEWEVKEIIIAKNYISSNSQQDSVVAHPGRIFINNIYNDPICADKYNQLEAFFYMNEEVIPFKSTLYVHPNYDSPDVEEMSCGPIESAYYFPFPVNSDQFSKEYRFLDQYFFRDNYTMNLSEDGKEWTWKGNRYIRKIVLTRQLIN